MTRISCWTLVLLTGLAVAKDKNKDKGVVPDYVLHARTVEVMISPDASTSLNQPMANTRALEDVSRALEAWGRFTIVTEGEPDLLIAVRAGTGQLIAPSIERGPVDNRVGTTRPGGGNVGIGAQQGRVQPIPIRWGRPCIPVLISETRLDGRMTLSKCIAEASRDPLTRRHCGATRPRMQ